MAITNHERVGKALELLRIGLSPFVEREFRNICKDGASAKIDGLIGDDRLNAKRPIVEKAPCCLNLPVGAMVRKGKFPIWGCHGVSIPGRGQGGVFLSGHDTGHGMVWA